MKKVAFYTLGCKVNQYETNAMSQKFAEKGYKIVNFEEVADIYIINTCTVTNMSDRKSRQMLRKVKEKNAKAILVACGCYVQVGKEELEKIEQIDLILGINEKNDIVEWVEKFVEQRQREEKVSDVMKQKEFLDFGSITYTERNRAVIKVQDGCDNFCSYCIIPYARGRVRSRKIESIEKEVTEIAKKGIKEIVLTGIHIASYGKDFNDGTSLIDLLKVLNQIEGIERIRLGSLEPTLMKESFIKEMKTLEKVCDHFHLSLQSGCDKTLTRMNRKYTAQEFYQGIKFLREAYPEAALTTDVIVGFPGETEEEFEETYQYLEKVNFYKIHVFKYSPRKGTKAASMEKQVDGKQKEQRSKKLIALSARQERKQNESYIGKKVKVLWEEYENGYWKGHTTNYILVKAKEEERNLANAISTVKIIGVDDLELIGKVE